MVAAHGRLRPGHIAAKLAVDASVVSRQLAGLHGWAWSSADRPRRPPRRAVSLTAAGHERLARTRDLMCGALAARLDHWDVDAVRDAAAMVEDLGRRLHEPLLPHPETTPGTTPGTSTSTASTKEIHV